MKFSRLPETGHKEALAKSMDWNHHGLMFMDLARDVPWCSPGKIMNVLINSWCSCQKPSEKTSESLVDWWSIHSWHKPSWTIIDPSMDGYWWSTQFTNHQTEWKNGYWWSIDSIRYTIDRWSIDYWWSIDSIDRLYPSNWAKNVAETSIDSIFPHSCL